MVSKAFTLVELLAVVVIMAIVMGMLVISLSQGQGRVVQMAAAQVASGMGLARQLAITKNSDALFIIAPISGTGAEAFYPEQPFRYWAVVYSNRDQGTWTLAKDWEPLPAGAVFAGLAGEGYNPLGWSTDGTLPPLGESFRPKIAASTKGEWTYFNSFTNFSINSSSGNITCSTIPYIGFKASGKGFVMKSPQGFGGSLTAMAVVLGEGTITPENEVLLRSTNNLTHVETDQRVGRITVRPRESYTGGRQN